MSNFLRPHVLYSPWNSPGQDTAVGSHSLLQWIFLTQESNRVSCIAGEFITRWDTRETIANIRITNKRRGTSQVGLLVKNLPVNAGDTCSIPGLEISTGEGISYPLQYSWASLVAQLVKNSPAMWSIPGLIRSPGKGKGYPLQYSGLENSMDCIVQGVAKSWTRLSIFHFHFYVYITWKFKNRC